MEINNKIYLCVHAGSDESNICSSGRQVQPSDTFLVFILS